MKLKNWSASTAVSTKIWLSSDFVDGHRKSMNIMLTSIKKSSIQFHISSISRVPIHGTWNVWLKAVWAMFVDMGLRSRKGTHNHCK